MNPACTVLQSILSGHLPPLAIKGLFSEAVYDRSSHRIMFGDFHSCDLARTIWRRQIEAALPGVALAVDVMPKKPTRALLDNGARERRAHIVATAAATLSEM